MLEPDGKNLGLPPIPAKRYFSVHEVSELCGVKPHLLYYWEHKFAQLKFVRRRGNRRYYKHDGVLLIRRIKELLYDEGLTFRGARNQLDRSIEANHEPGKEPQRGPACGRRRVLGLIKRELRAVLNTLQT